MTLAADDPAPVRRPSATLGALVLSASNVLRLVVQLAMLPILARLVGPAEYGLVALAVPFVLFCNMLADAGLSQALARRRDATPQMESTVFWIAGGLGAGLALLAAASAWPLGLALGQPRLPLLILALAPILVMSGFTAASNARIIRDGRFTVFAGGDFLSTAAAAAVAVWTAMNGAGAWALVAQQLTLWTVKFLWVNGHARPTVTAGFRPSEIKDLIRFGLHSIGSNLSDFIARNIDNVIVGAVLGTTALGFYAMAYQIVRIPDLVIAGPLYLYVFTAVSKAEARGGDLAISALRLTSIALAPIFAGLALIAPDAVEVVLGDKWRPAGPALAWLSAAGFGFSTSLVVGAILMGLGRSRTQLRLALLAGAVTVVAVAVFASFGVVAVSQALGAGILAVMLVGLVVLARDLKLPVAKVAGAFVPAAIGSAVLVALILATRPWLVGQSPLVRLIATIAVGGMAYTPTVFAVARRHLLTDARTFKQAHAA